MRSIEFVCTEARCVERVGTLRAQRTLAKTDVSFLYYLHSYYCISDGGAIFFF